MRQAYDYWQNQPGNYRTPGLATRPFFRAGELDTGHCTPRGAAGRGAPGKARTTPTTGFRLPPLDSPGQPSAATASACRRQRGAWRLGAAERRPQARNFSYTASVAAGYLPLLQVSLARTARRQQSPSSSAWSRSSQHYGPAHWLSNPLSGCRSSAVQLL